MNRIFHSIDIKQKIADELNITFDSLKVISAFCKLEALRYIDQCMSNKVLKKDLLIRFRLDDILSGASDFEIYEYCKQNNWRIYFDLNLHSKVYTFDRERIIIGSANLTSRGLGLGEKTNIESVVYIDQATEAEVLGINKFFEQAIEITDDTYNKMKLYLEKQSRTIVDKVKWQEDILDLFNKDVYYLWTTEMLFGSSPTETNEHDLSLLGIKEGCSVEELRSKLRESKAYQWLKTMLSEKEMYFGELTARLHNSLLDDPRPYRKDVKILLSNLLHWIEVLKLNEIIIDRPNHSQRVKLVS